MNRSLIISSVLHVALIFITAMSLPFLTKKPLDIPPVVSVELIQIAEKTNIPFAPKAKKIIEKKKKKKLKEKEKKLVSEQAPPKKVKKTKTKTVVSLDKKKEKIDNLTPEAVPLPDKIVKKIETKKEKKQNPDKLDEEVKQVSEFEKKEFVDLDNIAKLIDKAFESTQSNPQQLIIDKTNFYLGTTVLTELLKQNNEELDEIENLKFTHDPVLRYPDSRFKVSLPLKNYLVNGLIVGLCLSFLSIFLLIVSKNTY